MAIDIAPSDAKHRPWQSSYNLRLSKNPGVAECAIVLRQGCLTLN